MAKPIRFRHVNEAAGIFVLATLAVLVIVVVMAGHSQRWFQPVRRLTIVLPEEGSLGLRPGTEVFILGVSVGSVEDISPDAEGHMRADVTIRRDYSQFLHVDSKAVIRKTFGVAGDAYVEISRGSGAALPATGAVIHSSSDRAPTEMFGELLVQVRDEWIPTLRTAQAAMEEYRKVAVDLRDPEGHLQQTLARADRVTRNIEHGEGLAGRLVADPEMAKQVDAALTKVNTSLDQTDAVLKDARAAAASLARLTDSGNEQIKALPALIQQTQDTLRESQALLKDARHTTAMLPSTLASIDEALRGLPGLMVQTQETMRQVQRLVEGAQKHWLVQAYIEPEHTADTRIRPEDIGAGGSRP
jgi:phospholipid/cholesterol/gamma-HCH transport system substrate-binding protein